MPFYSPLRYPGGKRKLANFFKMTIKKNGLSDGHYIELYAGGAAVALELLFDEFVSRVHINDLDSSIYAFWHSVVYETEELCERIQSIDVTIDEWYHQREIQARAKGESLLTLGFSTFFLNRTNRSGIISGGVIGGKNQDGTYQMDARFNKDNLIQRIKRIGRYRSRISLYNEDAADIIQDTLGTLPDKTLAYLDPPYYGKGEGLYRNSYKHKGHEQIAESVREIDQPWVVTYDNTPEIRDMYAHCPSIVYDLHYSAADRYEGSEIMFFSSDLGLPSIDNPAKVNKSMIYGSVQLC